ncbi:sigma-70 family RNA polymerase sigma factor [Geitlerinema splendidum]|nr:sigma-70 family RNA polymerase sigma factor [Geitlerinema splendidum]
MEPEMDTSNELDEKLQQLAIEAQNHPPGTRQRQIALTKLVSTLQKSGQLCRPQLGRFPKEVYDDLYNETQQRVLLFVFQNINNYDPQRGKLIKWVNFMMDKRFIDVLRERSHKKIQYMPNIDELDRLCERNSLSIVKEVAQEIREYLQNDPEGKFSQVHISKNPRANFRAIALRYLEGRSWQEISNELNVGVSTLSSFYQRKLEKFAEHFREYLKDQHCL